jgi:tetratricopeptide (TPR) repeat protein
MKIILRLITLIIATIGCLLAQDAVENVKKYVLEKDYERAASYIPEAVAQKSKDINFILFCGDIYIELEQYEEALKLYQRADDIDGGEPPIMRKVGNALSLLNRHEEAINILLKAVKKDEKDASTKLVLAKAYIRAGNIDKATLEITRARELDKSSPDAFLALGDLYFAQKVYELARENYEEALRRNPNLIEARIKLATSYYWLASKEIDEDLSNELFTRSLNEWNKVTQQDSKNARAYFEQGKILFFSRKFAPAAQALYQYVQLRPTGYLGRWYLGQSLYEIGKCDSAAEHLQVVSDNLDSVRIKSKMLLARCYFENGKYSNAVEVYAQIKDSLQLDVTDLKRLGVSELNSADTLASIVTFISMFELYPEETCTDMLKFGKTLVKIKRFDDAARTFLIRTRTQACNDEYSSESYYWLGVSLFFAERDNASRKLTLDSAKNYLNKSLDLDASNLNARIYLGDIITLLGDVKSGEKEFNMVIESGASDTARYRTEISSAFQKICGNKLDAKNYTELIKTGLQWTKIQSDNVYAYLYTAIGYQGSNDLENACKYYKKATTIDPRNETAKKYIKSLNCP